QTSTPVPILGELSHHDDEESLVVNENSRSTIAELFRLIRTNLQYIIPGKSQQTILVTSSMSGEGKTFFTINLGAILALSGKKVIMLEFDIRKPRLLKSLGLEPQSPGITGYLVNFDLTPQDLIQHYNITNLDIVSAGPIPPNPSELLLSPRI